MGNKKQKTTFLKRSTALVYFIVGFLMCQPFVWLIMFSRENEGHMSLFSFILLSLFMIGAPLSGFGLVKLGSSNGNRSMQTEIDISRIRHSVETDRMNRR